MSIPLLITDLSIIIGGIEFYKLQRLSILVIRVTQIQVKSQ